MEEINILEVLEDIQDELYFAINDYKNGKNANIRDNGSDKIDTLIIRTKSYLEQFPEVWDMVDLKDEFYNYQYFYQDLSSLIKKIKNKGYGNN